MQCLAQADGRHQLAANIAERHFGKGSGPHAFLQKAAVPAAYTADSGGWAEDLAEPVGRTFIEMVNERSVFGRMKARPAPLNTRLVGVASGSTAFWRGEARPIPLSAMTLEASTLAPLSVTSMLVTTKELMRLGDPAAEAFLISDARRAMIEALDVALLDPANSGTNGVKPAAITTGITAIDANGITDVEYLLKAAVDDFEGDFATACWVATPATFTSLHDFTRPLIGPNGGELLGLPAYASRHVPASASGEHLFLIDGEGIAAGDLGVEIGVAEHASLEMLDASLLQNATTGAGAQMVSLWQSDCIAIRIIRHLNWAAVRPSVAVIKNLELEAVSA